MNSRPRFWRWALWITAAWSGAILWTVDRPPIQDLPQHLAALRILVDYGQDGLRFEEFFELELLRTQYLAFYLLAWVLAQFMSVMAATKVLLTAAIVTTPLASARLLRALGRDERLALLVVPLSYNAHLILGFLNFVAAIPCALYGLALAVELRERYSRGRAVGLAVVAFVTFYMHVVPFAFLGLGAALVALGEDSRRTVHRLIPLVPSAAAIAIWTQASPAGQSTMTAARWNDAGGGPEPQFQPWLDSLREVPMWLTDVFLVDTDDRLLVAWGILVLTILGIGQTHSSSTPVRRSTRAIGLLLPVAALCYFVAPTSYDWIWPIHARFPLLALLFLVPVLPRVSGLGGHLVLAAAALISFLSIRTASEAFARFDDEVGALDEAIAVIPEGSRTAGLIYARGSNAVRFSPFLHSVAYVQAERGGAAMFTFVDFPQSPVRFRPNRRPPEVPPRWEWEPARVDPDRDLDWYDWTLVRGGPGRIERSPQWQLAHESVPWRVYQRTGTPSGPATD